MEVSVNHLLSVDEAKKRILKLSEELKKEFGNQISNYEENWSNNSAEISFKAMGIKIKGQLDILSDKVTMNGNLPLIARPYKSQIENTIKSKLIDLLK